MNDGWNTASIDRVALAVYVAPGVGTRIHKDRPWHGIVLNTEENVSEYCFSDGRTMRTEGGALFYLPKNSTYEVKTIAECGCYAINFEAQIEDVPFCIYPKNIDRMKKQFKTACDEWRAHGRHAAAMSVLYDAIHRMQEEARSQYVPNAQRRMLAPAIERIERDFCRSDLTISQLSALCGVSDVYFRKLFRCIYGVSPKEYLIDKRMAYAKQLLRLGGIDVSRVAEMCGYGDPCHFSREFKRIFGTSPTHSF